MTDEGGVTPAVEVGLRRVAELDLAVPLPESDPRLLELIRDEIRRHGPMTFARFIELALYDPEGGYYTAPRGAEDQERGPGRAGDFLTAPEGHPIFGWAIARHVESVWTALGRPGRFVVREHGAGTGALAAGILDGLRRSGSPLDGAIRYQPVDASPARLEALAGRLANRGLADHVEPFDSRPETGLVLANELLDALPVHLVEGADGGAIRERFIVLGAGSSLTTRLDDPSTPALGARLQGEGINLRPGQPAEVCLAIDGWVRDAAASLARGELLLIDYGDDATSLYAPGRGSTLRAYHRHRVHDDPLVAIGRQDLTAHVDITAVEAAAAAAGLARVGRTTQARFLDSVGAGALLVGLQTDPDIGLGRYLEARSALVRMLDPRVTGAFAVLGFGRDVAPGAIRGFD